MMPMQRERYPENWEQISLEARERAGWECERCGVPNGALIMRSAVDGARFVIWDASVPGWRYQRGGLVDDDSFPAEYLTRKPTRVILTVHHVGIAKPDGAPGDPHDKLDCRPENLQALCQRCHLLADMPHHIANARLTRAEKKRAAAQAAGQGELF